MTLDEIRRFALSFPEASEGDHFGRASFKTAGKMFCTVGAEPAVMDIKLDLEDQANLAAAHPGIVEPVEGYWGRKGWTMRTTAWPPRNRPGRVTLIPDVLGGRRAQGASPA